MSLDSTSTAATFSAAVDFAAFLSQTSAPTKHSERKGRASRPVAAEAAAAADARSPHWRHVKSSKATLASVDDEDAAMPTAEATEYASKASGEKTEKLREHERDSRYSSEDTKSDDVDDSRASHGTRVDEPEEAVPPVNLDDLPQVIPEGELEQRVVLVDHDTGSMFETAFYKTISDDGKAIELRQRYHLRRVLARTLQGYTCKVWDRRDGREVVVKAANRALMASGRTLTATAVPEDFETEIGILRRLSSIPDPDPGVCLYIDDWTTETQRYLAIEYCDAGDLFEYTKAFLHGPTFKSPPQTSSRPLSARRIQRIHGFIDEMGAEAMTRQWPEFVEYKRYRMVRVLFAQFVRAVLWLKSQGVVHLDHSLENVLCLKPKKKVTADAPMRESASATMPPSTPGKSASPPLMAKISPLKRKKSDTDFADGAFDRRFEDSDDDYAMTDNSDEEIDSRSEDPDHLRAADDPLYDEVARLKIIDFGVARDYSAALETRRAQLRAHGFSDERIDADAERLLFREVMRDNRCVGKTKYQAPEVYDCKYDALRRRYDASRADAWCLGVMLFMMIFLRHPYQKPSRRSDHEFITLTSVPIEKGGGGLAKWIMQHRFERFIGPKAYDLLNRLFVVEPEKRLSLEEIVAHPFVAEELARLHARERIFAARELRQQRRTERKAARMARRAKRAKTVGSSPSAKGIVGCFRVSTGDETEFDECMSASQSASMSYSTKETPLVSTMPALSPVLDEEDDYEVESLDDAEVKMTTGTGKSATGSMLSWLAPAFEL